MGKPSDPPDSADAADMRHRFARLLSELLTLEDDTELEDFLRRRVGRQDAPDLAGLRQARDLLASLGQALQCADQLQWKRVSEAWQLLCAGDPDPLLATVPASQEAPGGSPAAFAAPPPVPRAVAVAAPPPAIGAADTTGDEPAERAELPSVPAPAQRPSPPAPARPAGPPRLDSGAPAQAATASPWAGAPATPAPAGDGPAAPPKAASPPTGGSALPFSGRKPTPPPSALADLESMDDIPLDRTVAADPGAGRGKTMPFAAAALEKAGARSGGSSAPPTGDEAAVGSPEQVPELTVEQYASYRATRDVFPERDEVTLRQYGMTTPELRQALDEQWQQRFASDAELRARYQTLLSKYAVWLRRHR